MTQLGRMRLLHIPVFETIGCSIRLIGWYSELRDCKERVTESELLFAFNGGDHEVQTSPRA